jgi:hypothetical protein
MPWTFAHPAAVLPLRRFCPARLNFSALVIGSMTPDFASHVHQWGIVELSHTYTGSALLCAPVGMVLWAALKVLEKPLCFVLPQPHRAALWPCRQAILPSRRLAALLKAVVSLLLGAWTHVAWDSFTHDGRGTVDWLPILRAPVLFWGTTPVPLYSVLQELSTVVGTVIVATAYVYWLRGRRDAVSTSSADNSDRWRYRLLLATAAIALAMAMPVAACVAWRAHGPLAVRIFMAVTAAYSALAFFPLLSLCAVVAYVRRR